MWLGERSKNLLCQFTAYFIYILMGAIIFQALEANNELLERQSMNVERREFQVKFNISDAAMDEFMVKVEEITDHGFNKDWVKRWSLIGSLFFAGTVVTTIGYGHVTPCTTAGRVFCMFYALIGIPLTWMMLSTLAQHIHEWIASILRYLHEHVLLRKAERIEVKVAIITSTVALSMVLIIAFFGWYLDGWPYLDGIYFGVITLTTIGFGDFVPLHPSAERDPETYPTHVLVFTILSVVYFTVGLAIVSSVLMSLRNTLEERSLKGFQMIKEHSDN